MARLSKAEVEVLASALEGTSNNIETALEQMDLYPADFDEDNIIEQLQAENVNLFRCDNCGYWCPLDEIAEDSDPPRCLDCCE